MSNSVNPFTEILTKYSTSVFEKNVASYVNLYSENVVIFDMWNDWYIKGIKQWRETAENWFNSLNAEKVVVTASDIQSYQFGEVIVGHTILRFAAINSDGLELRYLNNRVSINMQSIDGTWKIFHQHSSAPIDGKSVQVKFHKDDAE